MQVTPSLSNGDLLTWWLQQTGVRHAQLLALRPNFLVISPPKTGSTWLAENFRRHPQLFVPRGKEVKYFSSFFKSLDLNWYLDQFAAAGERAKGEASPSYSLLPVERIRLIRTLMPDVKLVFLMRDPIGRAWSHARHNYRHREANFAGCSALLDEVSDSQWVDNFSQAWTLASGDYLGQLRRWLSVFPREQLFVGFYETIAHDPETLLRDLFGFLGVRADVDFSLFPVRERILAGLPGDLSPALQGRLHQLLHDRSRELADFLRDHLELVPPSQWQTILAPMDHAGEAPPVPAALHAREFDEDYLAGVLAQEESFPSAWCPVLAGYRGYNILFYRGLLYAFEESLGEVPMWATSAATLEGYQAEHRCFVASSLAGVKDRVDQYHFEQSRSRLQELPPMQADLSDARQRIASLEGELHVALDTLRKVEADLIWLRPWFVFVECVVRPVWRWLLAVLGVKRRQPATVLAGERQGV